MKPRITSELPIVDATSDLQHPIAHKFAVAIDLEVDARDVKRGILHIRERLLVPMFGPVTLLYPEWLPGYHAPEAPLELVAGLRVTSGGQPVGWKRDPVQVHAIHIDLLEGQNIPLEVEFQLLCPTAPEQGRVGVTARQLNLQWNSVLFYPAGFITRQIGVQPSIILPARWAFACALETEGPQGSTTVFGQRPLDVVVDSPLFAGLHCSRYRLDTHISLNVFGDEDSQTEVTDDALDSLRNLIAETDQLFGARHFDHYDFLVAASDELGDLGVEHHRSAEMVVPPDFFSDWQATCSRNDLLAHEFLHSWNGKFRRGADSKTTSFDQPIRNRLLWVYEGLTQYWGQVLAVRSGLWQPNLFYGALARTAALSTLVAGRSWRPIGDTTADPVVASRKPLPWKSWQRSEDYYSDGQLIWLEADVLIRELTGGNRSLDDFGRSFFGMLDGSFETLTYELADVLETLNGLAPFDWGGFFDRHINEIGLPAPLDGLAKAGCTLEYREEPTAFQRRDDELQELIDLRFSLGLSADMEGKVKEVIWESPAFRAGMTAGVKILAVNDWEFSKARLDRAVSETAKTKSVKLSVQKLKHVEEIQISYVDGHRYPHLRLSEPQSQLTKILEARR